MTNSKVRNSDWAYSICFSQVLLKLFTFLINTADKEIYNIFNSFLFPYYFNTNRTNKHTNKQQSSFNIKDERATLARATRVDIDSILVLGPSALGKGENYLWEWKFKELTLHKNLTISYSESASSITPVEPLKPRFYTILKFVYFLVVNNNKCLSYFVDNIIFGISVPDYPSRTVESNSLRLF